MYTNILNVCNEIKICKRLKEDSNFILNKNIFITLILSILIIDNKVLNSERESTVNISSN